VYNFIEFLNYKVQLLYKLVRFRELAELYCFNEGLVESLSQMVCGIDFHHGITKCHNVCDHGFVDRILGFQECVQLPLAYISREILLISCTGRDYCNSLEER